ncbi:MAG: ABC transporter permease [Endomicrobium sp.]|jgi:ABC-2 type transport system permease protein|nr:ABC transporter permease [Endomicrobium sp.]
MFANLKNNPVIKVAQREIKRILSSKDLVLICFAAPIFYAALFSYVYINKTPRDINIGVINQDGRAQSRRFERWIDASPELKADKSYASVYETFEGIFADKISAFYFIPKNFGANLKKGRSAQGFNAANSSNFLVSTSVLKKLSFISALFAQKQYVKILSDKGVAYQAAKTSFSPLSPETKHIFNPQLAYSVFFLPCLLVALLQQILLMAVCAAISLEKKEKTEKELYKTAGGRFSNVFFGKALPYIFIGAAASFLNSFLVLPLNDIYVQSVLALTLISTAFVIAAVFFAILISVLFKSPEMAMAALMFYAMPAILLSGFAWPHHALPLFLKIVSYFIPSTYSANYIRLFTLGDISAKYAILPTLELLLFAASCFFAAMFIEKAAAKRKRRLQ